MSLNCSVIAGRKAHHPSQPAYSLRWVTRPRGFPGEAGALPIGMLAIERAGDDTHRCLIDEILLFFRARQVVGKIMHILAQTGDA